VDLGRSLECIVTRTDLVIGSGCAAPGAQRFTVVVAFLLPEAEARFRGLLLALAARGARVLTIVFQLEHGGGLELRGRVGNYVYLYTAPAGQPSASAPG